LNFNRKLTIEYSHIILFAIIVLLVSACDESTQPDTTPPTVSIQSPITNNPVFEIVSIEVASSDNEGVERIDFYIDDSLHFQDYDAPYVYHWNTTGYDDQSEHLIKAISYDEAENFTETQPIILTVDNSGSYPEQINITSINYTQDEMIISWAESVELDFSHYELLLSENEEGEKLPFASISDIVNTTYHLIDFDPTILTWYWLGTVDTLGLLTYSEGFPIIDSNPSILTLDEVTYINDSFLLEWDLCNDDDFYSYKVQQSSNQEFIDIYETINISDTSFAINNVDENNRMSYQIIVTDVWGLESHSNTVIGSSFNKIVYSNDEDGYKLKIVDIDGLNIRYVTDVAVDDQNVPKITSDGQKIIFLEPNCIFNGHECLSSINIYGTDKTRLAQNSNGYDGFDLSPDNSKIVFCGDHDIMIMNVDGTELIQLTSGQYDADPYFAPSGEKIVFYRQGNIFTIDIDGNNLYQLTDNTRHNKHPQFSPNGENIIFSSDRYSQNGWSNYWLYEIFVMDINGDNQTRLTFSDSQPPSNNREFPKYSPNGEKIVFCDNEDGVYLMDSDGSNLINISDESNGASFNSESTEIVFYYSGNINIYNISSNSIYELSEGRYPVFVP
jgi:Tol biopolymer transport system component